MRRGASVRLIKSDSAASVDVTIFRRRFLSESEREPCGDGERFGSAESDTVSEQKNAMGTSQTMRKKKLAVAGKGATR